MLVKRAFIITLFNIIGYILSFIALIFISRELGPENVGIIAFSISFVGLFKIFSDLGFGLTHIKLVSEGRNLNACIRTYASLKLILVFLSLSLPVLILKFSFTKNFFGIENTYVPIILVFIFGAAIRESSNIMINTYTGLSETFKQELPNLFSHVLTSLLKVVGILLLGFGLFHISLVYLLGEILILIFALYFFKGYVSKKREYLFADYFKIGMPIAFAGAMSTITLNIDTLFLNLFSGKEEVGIYFIPKAIFLPLIVIFTSILVVLLPEISRKSIIKEKDYIQNLLSNSYRTVSFLCSPFCIILFYVSPIILPLLFGNEFQSSVHVLQFFLIIFYFQSITDISRTCTIGLGYTTSILKITFWALMINVVFNLLFIPEEIFGVELFGYGALGAVLATLIAVFFRLFCYFYIIREYLTLSLFRSFIKQQINIIICIGATYTFTLSNSFTDYEFLFFVSLYVLGLFFSLSFIIGEFGKKDINRLLRIFDISSIFKYAKSELK